MSHRTEFNSSLMAEVEIGVCLYLCHDCGRGNRKELHPYPYHDDILLDIWKTSKNDIVRNEFI